jgi:predicted nucleic acid-binding protein
VQAYASDDESSLWQAVFEWLEKYNEHEPDWTDGYLAVVSARESKSKVWTYDRGFKTTWRRPDGSRIPLATSR